MKVTTLHATLLKIEKYSKTIKEISSKVLVLYFIYLALKIKSLLCISLKSNEHDLGCTWFTYYIFYISMRYKKLFRSFNSYSKTDFCGINVWYIQIM